MANSHEEPNPEIGEKIHNIQVILGHYPGLAGLEERKRCDENIRAHVAEVTGDFLHHVGSLETYLSKDPDSDDHARAADAWRQIETVFDKMQSTPYSFSPFFMFDRVPEEQQLKVLESDEEILRTTGRIKETLGPTLDENVDFSGLLNTVFRLATQLDIQLEARINTIMEFN